MRGSLHLTFCTCTLFALVAAIALAKENKSAGGGTAGAAAGASLAKPPDAHPQAVVDEMHGQKIPDPYRWLENGDDPQTLQYVKEQLAYTRSILDHLPGRDQTHQRLSELLSIGTLSAPQIGGDSYFYTRREGTQNQPILYVRRGLKGTDRVLVDVNQLAADGTVALDWWYPSHDGRYVAYGTSANGSEISTLHVIETATGRLLPDTIARTRAASLAWVPDASGFFYTRYPSQGEVPPGQEVYYRKVFYHALGTDPARDSLIFGDGRDPQDWPNVEISEDGRWLAITVEQGWAKSEVYLKDLAHDLPPAAVVTGQQNLYLAKPFRGKLYILSNEGAPRFRLFTANLNQPQRANWKEAIPQSVGVLKDFAIIGGELFAEYEQNATSQLKIFSLEGVLRNDVPMPTLGSLNLFHGNWDSKEAFFGFQSYAVPNTIYHYDLQSRTYDEWAKVDAPIAASNYAIKQLWFHSKDGTRVPMFVVSKKGLKLDGRNPTLLTGYGGFNVSRTPVFSPGLFVWLERGGVFAEANLRGGSEFGEEWHRAGMLEKKQNVFDDFIAAAEFLIQQKYTDKNHLAIRGGSNGGLLVGVAMTQRPELFKAVVCQVPLLDMLRYQNFSIAKLWIPEYGSSEDATQFQWLFAYSPYHHVTPGVSYPATLLMTADSDSRVDPMHAKKMAARLQAANAGPNQILLRVEPKAGHGAGKPITKLLEEGTDIYSFLFWQLGLPLK